MLRILGVDLRLAPDGALVASGPPVLVDASHAMLEKHRDELVAHLRLERELAA